MNAQESWTGRCLCGHIRFVAAGPPLHVSLCHCEDCRRSSGAPFQGWVFFPRGNFSLKQGELRRHVYEGRERSFCPDCGSPVTFTDQALPDLMEVALGSMDEAAMLKPDDYNWMADHLPWLALDPSLPGFNHNGPPPCLT